MKRYDTYKPSGISWIGEIPSHWTTMRLSSHFHDKVSKNEDYRFTHAHKFNYSTLAPKNEAGDVSEYKETYTGYNVLNKWDIVINGLNLNYDFVSQRVAMADEGCIITSAYLPIRPYDKTYSPFFLYLLKAMDSKKLLHGMGTGIRLTLSFNELKAQLLPIPPLDEQQKIVEFISTKTSLIDAQQRERERERELRLLDELKQAEIAKVVTRGLNPDVPMKDSGIPWIGQIPAHWDVRKIRSLYALRSEKVSDKEFAPLSVSKMGVTPQLEDAVKTDNGDNRKLVRKGDFVVNSRSDRKGSRGVSSLDGSVSLINIVVYPICELDSQYFHLLFRSNNYIEEFYRLGKGIVADLWTTKYEEMRNISVPFPPIEEQKAIVAYIEEKNKAIDEMIANLKAEIEFLTEYKQRLIADVVTGQIKVD